MTVAEMVQAEKELGKELEKYSGEWVAVCGQEVVAHAASLGELLEQVESQGLQDEATVLQVPEEKAAACFF